MDPFKLALILIAIVLLAVAGDAVLVLGWRRLREGKSFWDPRLVSWIKVGRPLARGLSPVTHRLSVFLSELRVAGRSLSDEIRSNDGVALRVALALAPVAVSVSLGMRDDVLLTTGWELWVWVACIGLAVAALTPWQQRPFRFQRADLWVLAPMALALVLRIWHLTTIPHGLHADEVGTADFTMRWVLAAPHSTLYPFRNGPSSQPALYYYLLHFSMQLFGQGIFGLRFPSVLAGVLGVGATFALVSVWSNRRMALLTAFLMSTYHYDVQWSRLALNNIWDTLWIPLALACLAWGWKAHWRGGAVLCGLAVGLSQYFYIGTRIGLLLIPYVVYRLWRDDPDARRLIIHIGTLIVVAFVVAAPLYAFAIKHPGPFLDRVKINWVWTPMMVERFGSDWLAPVRMALDQAWRSIAGFTTLPETTGFYGPGVPFLIGLAGPLFVAGIFWALRRRLYLPVLWILTTVFLAGFLSQGTPASSHYTAAIPAIAWLIAIPVQAIADLRHPRVALGLLALVMVTDVYFYFGVYVPAGDHPNLTHTFPADPTP